VRNTTPNHEKGVPIAGYSEDVLEAKFGALLHGVPVRAPPHAAWPRASTARVLLGVEETIRDVIAFPLNGNAQDLLMGAPSEVSEQQLREVHIKLR
jgi:aspartyl-tRNA synthetase